MPPPPLVSHPIVPSAPRPLVSSPSCPLVRIPLVSYLHRFTSSRLLSACLLFTCHFVTSSPHLLISCPIVTLSLIPLFPCCLSSPLLSLSSHVILSHTLLVYYYLIAHHLVRSFFFTLSAYLLIHLSPHIFAPCPLVRALFVSLALVHIVSRLSSFMPSSSLNNSFLICSFLCNLVYFSTHPFFSLSPCLLVPCSSFFVPSSVCPLHGRHLSAHLPS